MADLSYRVAMRRASFRRQNMRSICIALAIAAFLEWIGGHAVVLVGDDGFGLARVQPRPQIVAVVCRITQKLP